MRLIPDNTPFMLVWSDLILEGNTEIDTLPNKNSENYLGLARDFECRWSFKNNNFTEEPSVKDGVAGMFEPVAKYPF
ncbi:hypothetical protein FACS1894190_13790 [Spirochaetia bacterium]|nr:hypothetical protein FACS1894190_13790 [Spirochaetia bacterium]